MPQAIDGLKPVSTRATHPMNELDPLALPAAFGARTRLPGVARPRRVDASTDQRDELKRDRHNGQVQGDTVRRPPQLMYCTDRHKVQY